MNDGAVATSGLTSWQARSAASRRAAVHDAVRRAVETKSSHATFISTVGAPEAPFDGELVGLPIAVKDNIDVRGIATTAGSALFGNSAAEVDAGVVSVLRNAGAVVVGKTNMHELAFGVTSNNSIYGAVRNPVDPNYSAGGSSGGSAAAVALGVVEVSLGTDTGGSISIPASFCGVVGFRPSTGRYPADGVVGLSWSRDTVGLHTRDVATAVVVDRIITRTASRPAPTLAEITLGVPSSRYADLDPAVASVAEHALARLADAGVRIIQVEIEEDLSIGAQAGLDLVLFEAERLLAERARTGEPSRVRAFADLPSQVASPDVRELTDLIAQSPLPGTLYEAARTLRWELRRRYAELFELTGINAIVSPTCPVLPPPIGIDDVVYLNGREAPLFATITRLTGPGSVAGVPMLTLPSGVSSSGLPVGMTFEGRFLEDGALLALGEQLEAFLADGTT